MWISSDDTSSTLSMILQVSLRLVILGGLIFLATTYIPATPPVFINRVIISVIVVIIYSLLDIIAAALSKTKNKTCEWICGCPANGTITNLN